MGFFSDILGAVADGLVSAGEYVLTIDKRKNSYLQNLTGSELDDINNTAIFFSNDLDADDSDFTNSMLKEMYTKCQTALSLKQYNDSPDTEEIILKLMITLEKAYDYSGMDINNEV